MRLTQEEFDEVLPRVSTRMSARTIQAIELVLVHGYSQKQACQITGINTSHLSVRIIRFRKKLHEDVKCPEEWRLVKLCLPPSLESDLAALLRKIEKERSVYLASKSLKKNPKKK